MIKITPFVALLLCITTLFVSAAAMFVAAGTYDLKTAIDAVGYANVAYCEMAHVAKWSCSNCPQFPGVTDIAVAQVNYKGSSAFVAYDGPKNRIVIAFRGTVNAIGWVEDFDFLATQYDLNSGCGPECTVHEGLYWAYLGLMEQLLPQVQKLVAKYPTATVLCTGHSQGAAEAGFCQTDMILRFSNVTKGKIITYTFGEPRIGNGHFVKWQQTVLRETESFRVTNYGDPVVHLPPLFFDDIDLGKWIHNPREVFYQNNFGNPADYRICAGNYSYEDITCADSTPIWAMSFSHHTTYLNIPMGC